MAQNFNNAGFANVQAFVLNLPPTERHVETDSMRRNLDAWMSEKFELSASEQAQLAELCTALKERIAHAVADSWDAGQLILFDKQEKKPSTRSSEEKTPKDVILEDLGIISQSIQSTQRSESRQVSVRIQYR